MSVQVNIAEDFQRYLQTNKPNQGLGSVSQMKNNLKQLSSKLPFGLKTNSQDPQNERLLSNEGLSEKDEAESSSFFFWSGKGTQIKESQKCSLCPSLSRMQRLTGFVTCLFLAIFCFGSATFYIPLLVFKARKFVALYSLGTMFLISSFVFLKGVSAFATYIFARERIAFTAIYGGTLAATIYFSMFLQSTILTVLTAVFQFGILAWFLLSYIPGGATGLSFISRMFSSSVSRTLPI